MRKGGQATHTSPAYGGSVKPETRTFYEAAVVRTVERVGRSLDEALDLDALAREAALSAFHFQRVFRGEEQDSRRQDSLPRALGRRAAFTPQVGARGDLPDLQRRYVAMEGDDLGRPELSNEAIRLARHVVVLLPKEPEALGLLGLLLLIESRRPARTAADGSMVSLSEQDRALWMPSLVAEGQSLVRACLRMNRPGPYQLQAAINAVHSDAQRAEDTDWRQIATLYDHLLSVTPTPVVALNRAIAIAELGQVSEALALVDALPLSTYHLFHATRADLLRRVGRQREALAAYDSALRLTGNLAEVRFIEKRRDALMTCEMSARRRPPREG